MPTHIISLMCLDIMLCTSILYEPAFSSSAPQYIFNTDQQTLLVYSPETAPKPGEERRDTTDS
ncbi:MAG: hypothetical protein WBA93_00670 [Microcoleaceae cyanobacterium]